MRRLLLALSLAGLTLVPSTAAAQAYLGFQGNWSDLYDWGIGGRVTVDLSPKLIPLMIAGSYDYFWPGETLTRDFEYWEVNVNALFVQRVFGVGTGGYASGYFGIGLNVANRGPQSAGRNEIQDRPRRPVLRRRPHRLGCRAFQVHLRRGCGAGQGLLKRR